MTNIEKFKYNINNILIFFSVIELVIFFTWTNLIVVSLTLLNWILIKNFVLNKYNLINFPLSTFIIIGYSIFFIILPIPATMLEFKPVVFNLKNPIESFFNISLVLIILLLSFNFHKTFSKGNVLRPLFMRFGFFKSFSTNEIWYLTILSFISLIIGITNKTAIGEIKNSENSTTYIFNLLFGGFVNNPIVLLFPTLEILKNKIYNSNKIIVAAYSFFLFLIGIATNSRTAAVLFFSLGLFVLIILYLSDRLKLYITKGRIILAIITIYIITGPFMDISVAIIAARGEKNDLSYTELFNRTIDIYSNKNEIDLIKKMINHDKQSIQINDWDENYIDNDLFARFCSVKTIDETIYYAKKIGFGNEDMKADYYKQIIAIFPEVITSNIFGMSDNERKKITSYSETDYLYFLATNNSAGLGSFKIGSIQGIGLALFGYYYLLVLFVLFVILFYLFDATILITKNGKVLFSLWSIINILLIGYITSAGHNFHTEIRYILRGYWESIFFYLLAIYILNKTINVFNLKR